MGLREGSSAVAALALIDALSLDPSFKDCASICPKGGLVPDCTAVRAGRLEPTVVLGIDLSAEFLWARNSTVSAWQNSCGPYRPVLEYSDSGKIHAYTPGTTSRWVRGPVRGGLLRAQRDPGSRKAQREREHFKVDQHSKRFLGHDS